jgi:hypothetical protein
VNTEQVGHASSIKRILLSGVCMLALGLATAAGSSPAAAKYWPKRKLARKETEHVAKLPFGDIPKGPLEIFISINQQRLHFYSDGVHIADAPVATGVPGHLTPRGVFSVIERDRYHHSNIYDNAPMPFMERITWSGVALHQGPGVGHQASHGCIRMPEDFAARLWQLPTMGMRVIIAGPELRPVEFADPHLFVHKAPAPTAALTPPVEMAQASEPGAKTDAVVLPDAVPVATAPATAAPALAEKAAPASAQPSSPPAAPAAAARAQTAGAATAPPAAPAAPTTSQPAQPNNTAESLTAVVKAAVTDATEPSQQSAAAPAESTKTGAATEATPEAAPANPPVTAPSKPADEATIQAAAPATTQPAPVAPTASTTAPSTPSAPAPAATPTPTETTTQAAAPTATQPAPATPATASTTAPSTPSASAPATTPAPAEATTQAAAPAATQPAPATPATAATTVPSTPSAAVPSTTPAPAEAATAAPAADITAPISLDDVPLPPVKPARLAAGEGGPIAIFISRKTSKIYVRQNFSPVFDAPVKIENPSEPIGTHVFTAMDYLPDHSTFRWTVTTLPGEPPRAAEHWKYVRDAYGRRRRVRVEERVAAPAEPLPAPETPQEALARIEIPQDVLNQIEQLIVPGSSLVISDQGLGPETGRGTDFIVVQR